MSEFPNSLTINDYDCANLYYTKFMSITEFQIITTKNVYKTDFYTSLHQFWHIHRYPFDLITMHYCSEVSQVLSV